MEKACIYYKGRTVAGAESSVIKFRYTALLILSDILCTLSRVQTPGEHTANLSASSFLLMAYNVPVFGANHFR